jgi:hypothetical protein
MKRCISIVHVFVFKLCIHLVQIHFYMYPLHYFFLKSRLLSHSIVKYTLVLLKTKRSWHDKFQNARICNLLLKHYLIKRYETCVSFIKNEIFIRQELFCRLGNWIIIIISYSSWELLPCFVFIFFLYCLPISCFFFT